MNAKRAYTHDAWINFLNVWGNSHDAWINFHDVHCMIIYSMVLMSVMFLYYE
jgi:hypothetical protein